MGIQFERLDTSSIKDRAIEALEAKILSGEFEPGDKLPPERDIASDMGVSRGVISMCVLELEQKGFVKIVPRHGTFVSDYLREGSPGVLASLMHYSSDSLEPALFDGIVETRRLIELECTKLSALRAGESELEELSLALENMELSIDSDDFLYYDFKFHHVLSAASGNPLLAMIVKSFETTIVVFASRYYKTLESRREAVRLHSVLLSAIRAKDPASATEAINCILNKAFEGLAKTYKKSPEIEAK